MLNVKIAVLELLINYPLFSDGFIFNVCIKMWIYVRLLYKLQIVEIWVLQNSAGCLMNKELIVTIPNYR